MGIRKGIWSFIAGNKNMVIAVAILVVMSLIIMFGGGCGSIAHKFSHTKSSLFGLRRKITLYSLSGDELRSWEGRTKVEINGQTARFVINGKAITISGTFVIEEL